MGKTHAAERKALSLSLLEPRQVFRTQRTLFTQSRSGLTPRSSGPATAAVRACVVRSVMLHHAGPAVHRIGPLSSNVRRRKAPYRSRFFYNPNMTPIINALVAQWPALVGLLAIALVFWKMFEKHLDENRLLLGENKKLIEEYRLLSTHKVEEIDRLRKQFLGVLDENERVSKRYDEMKAEFSKLVMENRALKRTIDSIEEMLRATGGDVKVISTQLRKTQEDLDDVSSKITLLEYKGK